MCSGVCSNVCMHACVLRLRLVLCLCNYLRALGPSPSAAGPDLPSRRTVLKQRPKLSKKKKKKSIAAHFSFERCGAKFEFTRLSIMQVLY
jgi:hypothetical protein